MELKTFIHEFLIFVDFCIFLTVNFKVTTNHFPMAAKIKESSSSIDSKGKLVYFPPQLLTFHLGL